MNLNYDKVKHLTMQEIVEIINDSNIDSLNIQQILYCCIFSKNGIDYKRLSLLSPLLDQDDYSSILKYDKDYSISFLISIANKAYEDDLTKQAIFLLNRHNIEYIIPLLPYVDEDEIRYHLYKK